MLARHRNDAIVATKVWTPDDSKSTRQINAYGEAVRCDIVVAGAAQVRAQPPGDDRQHPSHVTARADGRQLRSGRRTVVRRGGKELVERFAR